jgi:hypothetical protein
LVIFVPRLAWTAARIVGSSAQFPAVQLYGEGESYM